MTEQERAYTYEFRCPKCRGSWRFEEFAAIAKDVFASFEGSGVCPLCGTTFSWIRPGKLEHKKWFEGLTRYTTNARCAFEGCNNAIDGRRKYCSVNCRQAAYYRRKKATSTT